MKALKERENAKPQVIAGDLNTGPAADTLKEELSASWQKVIDNGWSHPNTEQDTPFCTWCSENLIITGSSDQAIDHVLVKNALGSEPKRFWDGELMLKNAEGESITTSYSDHYGLSVLVTIAPSE